MSESERIIVRVEMESEIDENSPFTALQDTQITRIVRRALWCVPDETKMFLMAAMLVGDDHCCGEEGEPYFVCPNNSIWRNGLDNTEMLGDCFKLFENTMAASEYIASGGLGKLKLERNEKIGSYIIYAMKLDGAAIKLIQHSQPYATAPRR